MLILKMIMKITNYTQEELAKYLNVSRQTINYWLNGESISERSKEQICDKFMIPKTYFNISLEENIDYYRLIYLTIQNNWKRLNKDNNIIKTENDRINEILGEIEEDNYEGNNKLNLEDEEILLSLQNGCNPYTGELYPDNHILNDKKIKSFLERITLPEEKIEDIIEKLTPSEKERYNKIHTWRTNKARELNIYPAYFIFNRPEMVNLARAKIYCKNDLLKVNGIGAKKYESYGNELFELLKEENIYSKHGYEDNINTFYKNRYSKENYENAYDGIF